MGVEEETGVSWHKCFILRKLEAPVILCGVLSGVLASVWARRFLRLGIEPFLLFCDISRCLHRQKRVCLLIVSDLFLFSFGFFVARASSG